MEEITKMSLGKKFRYRSNTKQTQCLSCKKVYQKVIIINDKSFDLAKYLFYLADIQICNDHVLCKKCANILLIACHFKHKILSQTVNKSENVKVSKTGENHNGSVSVELDKIKSEASTAAEKKAISCPILNCPRCHISAHENGSSHRSEGKVKDTEPVKLPFKCMYCKKFYKDHSSLTHHEKKHVSTRNMYKILRCTESNLSPKNVFHSKTCPNRHASVEKLCNRCGKIIRSLSKHKCAVAKKNVSKIYTCEACGKSFLRYGTYWSHKKYSHSEEKSTYDCTFCNKVCNNANTLREHTIRNHNDGVMPYVCKICTKGFPTSSKIKRHMSIHSYEKKYRCEKCETSFSQSAKLKIHLNEFHKDSTTPKEDIGHSMNLINNGFQTISIMENNDGIQEVHSEKSQW